MTKVVQWSSVISR